jgi:hypothetical protein
MGARFFKKYFKYSAQLAELLIAAGWISTLHSR